MTKFSGKKRGDIMNIPYSNQFYTGEELKNIEILLNTGKLEGDGFYTHKCQSEIEKIH